MSISLVLHGYVVTRGRASTADDPNSAWNRSAIDNILRLSNSINSLSPKLLRSGFNFGNLFRAAEISVLRNIWVENNKRTRSQMKAMLSAMEAESGSLQGTVIVEKLDFLISHADEQSLNEQRLLRRILDGAVAIIDLSTDGARNFVKLEPDRVTKDDISRLISEAADNRALLRQRCQGVAAVQKKPLRAADNEVTKNEMKLEPARDLFSHPGYRRVPIKPEE